MNSLVGMCNLEALGVNRIVRVNRVVNNLVKQDIVELDIIGLVEDMLLLEVGIRGILMELLRIIRGNLQAVEDKLLEHLGLGKFGVEDNHTVVTVRDILVGHRVKHKVRDMRLEHHLVAFHMVRDMLLVKVR